jgi:hypothetical protein
MRKAASSVVSFEAIWMTSAAPNRSSSAIDLYAGATDEQLGLGAVQHGEEPVAVPHLGRPDFAAGKASFVVAPGNCFFPAPFVETVVRSETHPLAFRGSNVARILSLSS